MTKLTKETVNHPDHYASHPSGVECIDIIEHMTFNLGNAVKYIWRADLKENAVEDMEKATWYIKRELQRRDKDFIEGRNVTIIPCGDILTIDGLSDVQDHVFRIVYKTKNGSYVIQSTIDKEKKFTLAKKYLKLKDK